MTDPRSPDDPDPWPTFDESFVDAAAIRERDPAAARGKASRASMREVKREAKQRRRDAKRPPKSRNRNRRVQWKRPVILGASIVTAVGAVAWYGWVYAPAGLEAGRVVDELRSRVDDNRSGTADPSIDPWEGSAAATWPTSIERPPAKALAGFPRSDVEDAIQAAERYVRTSMLDPDVLYGGATEPVLRTLQDSDTLRDYLGNPHSDISWTNAATRFKPKVVGSADDVIHLRGFLRPVVLEGELAVNYSFAIGYALRALREAEPLPQVVIVRREGTLAFLDAVPGEVGLPFPSYMAAVSDHSVCKSKWPYPAFTQVWLKPPSIDDGPSAPPSQSVDLTDPNDSLRKITECFTNSGSR